MKITTKVASEILAGLSALDGYQRVAKDGDRETIALVPYKIDGKTRRKIHKNIARLKPEIEAFNNAARDLFRQVSGGRDRMDGNKNPADVPLLAHYNDEQRKLMDEEVDVELVKIQVNRIMDESEVPNPIPGSVMALLDPILTDEADPT